MNGYEELANAIIVLAAKDYLKVLKILNKAPDNKAAVSEKENIERFFRSSFYETLTDADGEVLIANFRKEALL